MVSEMCPPTTFKSINFYFCIICGHEEFWQFKTKLSLTSHLSHHPSHGQGTSKIVRSCYGYIIMLTYVSPQQLNKEKNINVLLLRQKGYTTWMIQRFPTADILYIKCQHYYK